MGFCKGFCINLPGVTRNASRCAKLTNDVDLFDDESFRIYNYNDILESDVIINAKLK